MSEQSNSTIEALALSMVTTEISRLKYAKCYVTNAISYDMREVIKRARKNYYGVFDKPLDEATGRDKIWIPLTQHTVENMVKNIDLDTKDINLKSKVPGRIAITTVNRLILREQLHKIGFGELLDDIERRMTIDGTCVVHTWKGTDNVSGKEILKSKIVDLLNFYIDPCAESIQDAEFVTERVIMSAAQFKKMKGYINLDKIEGSTNISDVDDISVTTQSTNKEVEVFIREGWFPRNLLTGNSDDEDDLVFGQIVASGVNDKGGGFIHKIKKLDRDYKAYEECWLRRVPGRWYGMGTAEQLFDIQVYLNEIVNLRINNSRIFQTGLFKARKGSGVNNRTLQNLISGGVIMVDNLTDIEQFNKGNSNLGESIQDEQNMIQWGQRVTHSFDISTGEMMPSTTPATSVAIANQNVKSSFVLIQEELGMFLQRLIQRQWFPIMKELTDAEDILRVTGDPADLVMIDETRVNHLMNKTISKYFLKNKKFPSPDLVGFFKQKLINSESKKGKDRFFQPDVFLDTEYEVEIYVTNEDFDKNTILKNIESILMGVGQMIPNLDKEGLVTEYLDILGIDGDRFIKQQPPQPKQGQPQEETVAQGTVTSEGGNQLGANENPPTPGALIAQTTSKAVEGNA